MNLARVKRRLIKATRLYPILALAVLAIAYFLGAFTEQEDPLVTQSALITGLYLFVGLVPLLFIIGFIIFSTVVPSLFLAFDLVHKEYFESNVNRFIQVSFKNNTNILVLSQDIDYRKKQVKLTLAGNRLSENDIAPPRYRTNPFVWLKKNF